MMAEKLKHIESAAASEITVLKEQNNKTSCTSSCGITLIVIQFETKSECVNISTQCGILYITQPYGPPGPVTVLVLLLYIDDVRT
jgi:hypothetical protein